MKINLPFPGDSLWEFSFNKHKSIEKIAGFSGNNLFINPIKVNYDIRCSVFKKKAILWVGFR